MGGREESSRGTRPLRQGRASPVYTVDAALGGEACKPPARQRKLFNTILTGIHMCICV